MKLDENGKDKVEKEKKKTITTYVHSDAHIHEWRR